MHPDAREQSRQVSRLQEEYRQEPFTRVAPILKSALRFSPAGKRDTLAW